MFLAVDIGNTNIVLGIYHENNWQYFWRIESLHAESNLFFEEQIKEHFQKENLSPLQIEQIVISSVVPPLTEKIQLVISNIFSATSLLINPTIYPKIQVKINNPNEIGTDLVANAVAAHHHYKSNCIVVDFGTALTFTTVTKAGKILGVAIAPGIKTAVKALAGNAAQLPEVPMEVPDSAIGKNTIQAIQGGIHVGYIGLVRHVIATIRAEVGVDFIAIATGGLSTVLGDLKKDFVAIDKNLTLEGLRIIGEYLKS